MLSQVNALTAVELKHKEVFSTLNSQNITTGILYQSVPEYISLNSLDGTVIEDSTIITIPVFKMAYGMITKAYIEQSDFVSLDSFYSISNEYKNATKHYISLMHFNYDRIKKTAIIDSLIYIDNEHFYDSSNQNESPYENEILFASTLFKHASTQLTNQFIFNQSDYFTNSLDSAEIIEIDFDDGNAWQTINFDSTYNITYQDYDTFFIKIKKTLPTGETLISHTPLVCKDVSFSKSIKNIQKRGVEEYVCCPSEDSIFLDGVRLDFWFGSCVDTERIPGVLPIRKPLIICEGIDPLNNIFYHTKGFWNNEIYQSPSLQNDLEFLEKEFAQGNQLKDILWENGYDLIWINFNDATISISENANNVRKAIEWINEQKKVYNSEEENVLIGFSMGGLVCKWALSDMENVGKDHETEILLTVDSPLKGANLPLGYQAFLIELANYEILGKIKVAEINAELAGVVDIFKSPALKEMLYYNYNLWGDSKNSKVIDLSIEHDAFYSVFETKNVSIPHIAIANSSLEGEGQTYNPGDLLYNKQINFFETLTIGNFPLGNDGIIDEGSGWGISHAVKGGLTINPEIYALPDGAGTVFEGSFHSHFGVTSSGSIVAPLIQELFDLPNPGIVANVNLFSSDFSLTVENAKPFDSAPSCIMKWDFGSGSDLIINNDFTQSTFGFIPTISALALDISEPYHLGTDLSDIKTVLNSGLTEIDDYIGVIGSTTNTFDRSATSTEIGNHQLHVSFDANNVAYLLDYLLNEAVSPYPQLPVPQNNETLVYNYGNSNIPYSCFDGSISFRKTKEVLEVSLEVNKDGTLAVNNKGRIAYSNVPANPQNQTNSHFTLHITTELCNNDGVIINVNNRGEIKVGDQTNDTNNTGDLFIHSKAEVNIKSGGKVYVDKSSKIIVEGGDLIIESGGLLESVWHSKIIVKEGGTLLVKSGGELRIRDNSQLVIEEGGTIVIEQGAELQLWGFDPVAESRSNILIKQLGLFNYLGEPIISGNGYLQFDTGSGLAVEPGVDFKLTGHSKDKRLIRLNGGRLVLDHSKFDFKSFRIDYNGGSIKALDNVGVDFDRISLVGEGTYSGIGIDATRNNNIKIFLCEFNNLEIGIRSEENDLADFDVSYSDFNNNNTGVESFLDDHIHFLYCNFTGVNRGLTLNFTEKSTFQNCVFSDFEGDRTQNKSTAQAAIVAIGNFDFAPDIHLSNSTITDCGIGIFSPAWESCSVLLKDDATIENNITGIYMPGALADSGFGPNSRVVSVDCSNIRNNFVAGVSGQSIHLMIDALHPSIGSNDFSHDTGLIFDIWDLDPSYLLTGIQANNNFWGENNDINYCPQNFTDYYLSANLPNDIDLIDNFCPDQELTCLPGGSEEPCPPTEEGSECPCKFTMVNGNNVNRQWNEGMTAYKNLEFDLMEQLLSPIASLGPTGRETDECNALVDHARALVPYNFQSVPNLPEFKVSKKEYLNNEEYFIYPNPFVDKINLQIPEEADLIITNSFGTILYKELKKGNVEIDSKNWPSGLYIVSIEKKIFKLIKI